MTKYFLQGGGEGTISEANKNFFQTFIQGLPKKISILCIYIARDKRLNV